MLKNINKDVEENFIEKFIVTTDKFILKFAQTDNEIDDAKRLRFELFEENVPLTINTQARCGYDEDKYDPYCYHLIVIEKTINRVVGTYRLMSGEAAKKGVGFLCETEFDSRNLYELSGRILEVGRSCVHNEYRQSGVISLLWSGLACFFFNGGFDCFFGNVSVSIDCKLTPTEIYHYLDKHYRSIHSNLVPPLAKNIYNVDLTYRAIEFTDLPPLFKGYLRLGCRLVGNPSIEERGLVVSYPILVTIKDIASRYLSHFSRLFKVVNDE